VIVGAVCARGGSRGVPGKALREVAGTTLLARAIDCALACPALERVVVSTDDPEIAHAARERGAEVPFLRPAELATDEAPKWQVFRHLAGALEAAGGGAVEVLADLDVGAPLRTAEDVAGAVAALGERPDLDLVVTAYPADRNPYFNQVELAPDGAARLSKHPPRPIHNRQQAPAVYSLSPAVFAIRRDALGRHEHWSRARFGIYPLPRERAWDVDEEIDLEFVDWLLRRRGEGG
jgi:N-acylneuraminate cytidylyltransferase/CMP-N,N'-diacetyllegionaminic acid synthase